DFLAIETAPKCMQRQTGMLAQRIPHRHFDGIDRHDGSAFVVVVAGAEHMPMQFFDLLDRAADGQRHDNSLQHWLYEIQQADCFTITLEAALRFNLDDEPRGAAAPTAAPEQFGGE